jgi:hypothetical protein
MLQRLTALVFGTLMIVPTAASAADSSTLAPGKAAGVHEAELSAPTWVWIAGIGLVGLGIGLAASSGGGHSSGSTTNTHL